MDASRISLALSDLSVWYRKEIMRQGPCPITFTMNTNILYICERRIKKNHMANGPVLYVLHHDIDDHRKSLLYGQLRPASRLRYN